VPREFKIPGVYISETGHEGRLVYTGTDRNTIEPFRINPGQPNLPQQPIRQAPSGCIGGTMATGDDNVYVDGTIGLSTANWGGTSDSAGGITFVPYTDTVFPDITTEPTDIEGIKEDIKKFLESQGTYTTEDIKAMIRAIEARLEAYIGSLEQKVQALEETNKEILEKLNFLCERRTRALNLQIR
jgi:hypothetical protein